MKSINFYTSRITLGGIFICLSMKLFYKNRVRDRNDSLEMIFLYEEKKNKKPLNIERYNDLLKVPDGFEPPIRELQSHALPLGYGTIFYYDSDGN